jgi:shikimate dehydrogenase
MAEAHAEIRLYAVFGRPIAHSLSPRLHAAGFAARGLRHCYYVPVTVAPEDLLSALTAFRRLGGAGVNLTRPLKEIAAASDFLVARDAWAERTGAVNTLAAAPGGWTGANTDAPALAAALRSRGVAPTAALVFGAGGAARASVAALESLGATVTVASRRRPAEEPLASGGWVPWGDGVARAAAFDVVVNATPLGQAGEPSWPALPAWRSGMVAVDWVYVPRETPFLAGARAAGALVIDGLELLVRQAALAWVPWFGEPGPLAAMGEAVGWSPSDRREP